MDIKALIKFKLSPYDSITEEAVELSGAPPRGTSVVCDSPYQWHLHGALGLRARSNPYLYVSPRGE